MDESATLPAPTPEVASDTKLCPFCVEEIKAAAMLCRFCGSTLQVEPQPVAKSPVPTRHPEIVVSIPGDADAGLIRSRVHKALTAAGYDDEASAYLDETNGLKSEPTALVKQSGEWVTIDGSLTNPPESVQRSAATVPPREEDAPTTQASGLRQPVNPLLALALIAALAIGAIVIFMARSSGDDDEPADTWREHEELWDERPVQQRPVAQRTVVDSYCQLQPGLFGNEVNAYTRIQVWSDGTTSSSGWC